VALLAAHRRAARAGHRGDRGSALRGTFVKTLVELAEHDPRVVLLTGDLGFTVIEPFAERFPERFFNVGVAEQNMVGVATGLAEAGFRPYVYSIATFATMRPYEFIRNGPVHQRLPVTIVGVGAGLEYGSNGVTHYALEDLALMRVQPGLTVVAPADYLQARTALHAVADLPGPVYLRLGKNDTVSVPGLDGRFALGRAQLLGDGSDVLLVATGSIALNAFAAMEALSAVGVGASLLVVASVSPPPVDDLVETLGGFPVALTVEAHYLAGGLGSLVSEVVAEHGLACRVVRCGVANALGGLSGSEDYLYETTGLSPEALAATAVQAATGVRPGSERDQTPVGAPWPARAPQRPKA
jgi:transketolase